MSPPKSCGMQTRDLARVLVDTSAWIDFFRKAEPCYSAVSDLMGHQRICCLGIVVAELMQGSRSEKELTVLSDFVHVFEFLPESTSAWQEAGKLSWRLRRKGLTVGLSDCYIAAAARRADAAILSLDAHFALMRDEAGIRLHELAV